MKKKIGCSLFVMVLWAILFLNGCAGRRLTLQRSVDEPVSSREDADLALQEDAAFQAPEEGDARLRETEEASEGAIAVYLCGAVQRPDVYELARGSRVKDALTLAGGFTREADESACNLARVLTDGEMIRILTREETALLASEGSFGEVPSGDASGTQSASFPEGEEASGSGLICINQANAQELMQLPGIGKARAEAILACRERLGGFTSLEQLKEADGIGDGLFAKIKDLITLA